MNGLLPPETEKVICKSHRFYLDLFKSDDQKSPEYSYQALLKPVSKNHELETSCVEFEDNDADQLVALAKRFEEKYGSASNKSGKKKSLNDFVDIGYGYDEDDAFIDNSEAYDEVVPSDWTTEHGGFYINQGNLDFRPLSTDKNTGKSITLSSKKKRKKKAIDEHKLSKTPKELSTQKKKKQFLNKEKQRKRQESLLKAHKFLNKKHKKKNLSVIDDSSQDGLPLAQLNKSFEDDVPLSKIRKSSNDDSLKHASVDENLPLAKVFPPPAVNGTNMMADGKNIKTTCATNAVQSNVAAGGVTPTAALETAKAVTVKVESPLPEGLSAELHEDINLLRQFSETSVKGKFFNAEVNKVLLSFARKCRKQSPKLRNAVYEHILFYLPCAKDTLVKRCRALVVQHQRDLEDEPMRLLQQGINTSMPAQKKSYDDDVAQALQEQAREQIKQTGVDPKKTEEENSANGEDKNKKKFPKRKYNWSDEVRKLLCDVISVRVGLYKMSKSRSMSAEEYIKDFLESEIRKMWPKGWMTTRILYKESRTAHQEITQPFTKGKKTPKKELDEASDSSTSAPPITSLNSSLNVHSAPPLVSKLTILTPTSSNTMPTISAKIAQSSVKVVASTQKLATPVYTIINRPSLSNSKNNTSNRNSPGTPGSSLINSLPQHLKITPRSNPLGSTNNKFVTTTNAFLYTQSKNEAKVTLMKVHTPNNVTRSLESTKTVVVTPTTHRTLQNTFTTAIEASPKVSPFANTPKIVRAPSSGFTVKIGQENSKAVKRKTPTNMEVSSASKKHVTTGFDFMLSPPKSMENEMKKRPWSDVENEMKKRPWSDVENELVRLSHQASISRLTQENLKQLMTVDPKSVGEGHQYAQHQKSWQPPTNYRTTPTVQKSNNTGKPSQVFQKSSSTSLTNKRTMKLSSFAQNIRSTAPRHQNLHHVSLSSPSHPSLPHAAQHVASSLRVMSHEAATNLSVPQHQSLNKISQRRSAVSLQQYVQNHQPSVEEQSLEYHVPQHPAARLHQANETGARQYPSRYIQSNKLAADQQGLQTPISSSSLHASHPTMQLMDELNTLAANVGKSALSHHNHHPSSHVVHNSQSMMAGFNQSMQGISEQQRLMAKQQTDLLKQEAMKRVPVRFLFRLF